MTVQEKESPTFNGQIGDVLDLPNGARFYRCALQVNPFAYVIRQKKQTDFKTEAEYNRAIVEKCLELGIEVIAVTDHYRADESLGLLEAAAQAGLFAFPGFEAVTRDGIHFLCIFDPARAQSLQSFIGECGVHDFTEESPLGSIYAPQLLEKARHWGAVCVAAHVCADSGLLKVLKGKARADVWTDGNLLVAALPGPISAAPPEYRSIIDNKDVAHKRDRPVAIVNAGDVNGPADLEETSKSCFIKMSEVSIEALRQAFLDPESRIRLHSDPLPDPHTEMTAMTWEGGFLDGTKVHFNSNLNTLIGGRGTGKSTIIESIRYVLGLEPTGEEAQRAHEGIVRGVLKSGTRVSLLLKSHSPSDRRYLIQRTVPNPPTVFDEHGEALPLSPADVLPGIEVFGQHEISELTKSAEKLTRLLDRFRKDDEGAEARKIELLQQLASSRARIAQLQNDLRALDERLSALPALEETQSRFQEAGLEERLKEKSVLVREERLFAQADEIFDSLGEVHSSLAESLPVDTAFLSAKAVEDLTNADLLEEVSGALSSLSSKLTNIEGQFRQALSDARADVTSVKTRWNERRQASDVRYEELLRELQKSSVDGEEFIKLRRQIENLRPLQAKQETLQRDLQAQFQRRTRLVNEWEELKASEFRALQKAAKKVSKKLPDQVKVEVTMAGNRDPLENAIRELGGNLSAAINRLRAIEGFSLIEFVQRAREGKDALVQHYGLPAGAAEKIATADSDLFMRIEELDLPATTLVELNVGDNPEEPNWRSLDALSTGQRATAVLLLLLLESEAPLVVDQPEDDLDNSFIGDGIVPIMRREKRKRQFLFSTHNANIPVLGDAELILGLVASGAPEEGQGKIPRNHMGSIDYAPIRQLVEELLEGGKTAFEMRRSKYGF